MDYFLNLFYSKPKQTSTWMQVPDWLCFERFYNLSHMHLIVIILLLRLPGHQGLAVVQKTMEAWHLDLRLRLRRKFG